MKITENLHLGLGQIKNPSPEKFKFFVNATILIFGFLVTPTLLAIVNYFPNSVSPELVGFIKDFMLILSAFLKAFEKLLGNPNQLTQ